MRRKTPLATQNASTSVEPESVYTATTATTAFDIRITKLRMLCLTRLHTYSYLQVPKYYVWSLQHQKASIALSCAYEVRRYVQVQGLYMACAETILVQVPTPPPPTVCQLGPSLSLGVRGDAPAPYLVPPHTRHGLHLYISSNIKV